MEKTYLFLAEGFEEVEALTVVDLLRRAQIATEMVSMNGTQFVTGSHHITVTADCIFEEKAFDDGTWLILPGGMPGTKHLAAHKGLTALLQKAKAEGKHLAAICAAPTVFGGLGLLEKEAAACYPGMEAQLTGARVVFDPVVVSGQVTTSRGMGTAIAFGLELVRQIKGKAEADALGKAIVWNV